MLSLWYFLFFISGIYCGRNNVCESYLAYNSKGVSNKCHYDPDADTNDLPAIIKHHTGKESEIHEATTEDGYILTMHRIPRKNPRGILWLQHPLIVDALIWVAQSNSSLAFLAYEAGYDVWIPSQRGTTLSPGHVNLTTKDFKYWTWSFHEIGIYDYRTINEYIVEKTNRTDIIFVGHSLSSTCSIVYASMYPEEARNNVKVFINLATPVFFEHLTPVLKLLARLGIMFNPISDFLKIGPIFRYENPFLRLAMVRSVYFPFNAFVYLGVDIICGFTFGEQDPRSIGLVANKVPRGIALKVLYHYAQLVRAKNKFRQFDYRNKNEEVYGTKDPPEYPLDKIIAPFYFINSDADMIATEKDNDELYNRLPEEVKKYGRHKLASVSHADYFIGKHIKEKIYDHIIDFMNKL